MPSNNGPLGILPGMTFDPVRNRYFLTPPETPTPTPTLPNPPRQRGPPKGMLPPPRCFEGRSNKRIKAAHTSQSHVARPRTGRMMQGSQRRVGADTNRDMMQGRMWAGMDFDSAFKCGGCGGQNITSVKSYMGGAFHATTDHGEVIVHRKDKETHAIAVCAASLVGLHTDIPRMTMMAVAAGPEAHVHHFRRDPENLDEVWMQHSELDLSQGDIYSMSSYDGACSLGSTRSLVTITYEDTLRHSRRRIKSDALAVHHHDSNLVYAGLRNGVVSLEDLRVEPGGVNKVGHTIKGKAVVGVKRLKDSAVPWGMVVSGLDSELLLFDVRFPKTPMTQFHGHINRQYSDLGLDTTHDDTYLFAAGSDNRLRLYHTFTGRRVSAFDRDPADGSAPDVLAPNRIGPNESNPLKRIFHDRITSISVREGDCAVDLSSRGQISRFQWSELGGLADFDDDWDLESMDEDEL